MKFSAFFIISFLSVISCGSVLSDDKSESYELGTISDTNSEIKKNNFSKTEIPDDSLDFALFNMMLASGKYSEAEIIKNAEILIKKGANPNISIEYNYFVRKLGTYIPIVKHFYNNKYRHYTANSTAFIEAVNMNNINVVKKFVELGADVNKVSKDGEYPLNTAVFHNSKGIFDFLLEKGADISVIDLSRNKDIDFIEYAVKKGADPKTININFALKGGEELKRILALKPDINKFPLDYEVIFKNDTLLLFLLKNGLNNSVRGTFPDDCPMIYGAIRYADLNAVKTLKKISINIFDNCGGIKSNVLFEIIKKEKKEILDYYLNVEKADPDTKDRSAKSALSVAVSTDNDEIIKLLIKAGADIEYDGYFNKTPLMQAASYDKYISAQTLINAGANVNYKNRYGETALVKAITKKNLAVIELLVENGADTKIKYKKMSLSEYAESINAQNMIIEYLKDAEK